ncbi:tRNA (adenosine(37)-N6)-threonylcarbamoyltransferase complex ATPase subunit type 1 TsaE [Flavobacterium psychrophilum]|uniref:tRNA (adenosine(37)-N6)-threonylcarbamoyltransferase complex ATPase subunit type 1 TsaE n=1 Tax=Flavobacterium psychrophilum TaxID=96345 RepID=UPI001068FFF3|nr:tRNA (adenosine(37)-N6)-threonylcarbamoyltransferase complex ATPase subunit type 1 TsaE [Flavobacterium psychrophilum]EKT3957712.1 tRNA (adenosine(37)-N6)-threonylcarbamoyltransferase complex ATPase subunit type 1 TsaE [Flavobacterium psychrophilum]EKT4509200.1 tRNA (adenosine(37)-N6)-threonylcarbamoyltransferase complex ATPase subunit type 1 TsaE [Flavobacterium psychrophilum]MCB6231402.1 tRNA (adenosine(37)-N6)-threonylcarbamoyltransferase complex ATPase subunit type 1 TsaE [Flavobacterium 
MKIEFNLDEIEIVSKKILSKNPEKVILFKGEMGAGKTTLIKVLCKQLGVKSPTSSPTFSLVNEYKSDNNKLIYHFDLYRLKNQNEALDMGIDEYLYSENWCFIEWSEKISDLIPEKHSIITISVLNNNKRLIELK